MANKNSIAPGNIAGDFFVDTSCISCGNCRDLAPTVFSKVASCYVVTKQPSTEDELKQSLDALVCCPEGSIGTHNSYDLKSIVNSFPRQIFDSSEEQENAESVYYLGFNSANSAGGKSYFVCHPDGNWMIDSPKFTTRLVQWIEKKGGLKHIFLTHRDDVAEASSYAKKFAAKRIIHEEELEAQPDAEIVISGFESRIFGSDFVLIPTPGHTQGHLMLLFKNKVLFSGDVFTANHAGTKLEVWSPFYCWYSWQEQTKSIEKLLNYEFNAVLPAHGIRLILDSTKMHEELKSAILRCKNEPEPEPVSQARIEFFEMLSSWFQSLNMPSYSKQMAEKVISLKKLL